MTEHDLTALANEMDSADVRAGSGMFARAAADLAQGYLDLKSERDDLKRLLAAVAAERDALKAQLEDERVWRRDAERVAGGGTCSCWLGRVGATCGSSVERQLCAVHGDEVEP